MRLLLSISILFIGFLSFATSDTLFTIKVLTKRKVDPVHEVLVQALDSLGFQKDNSNQVFAEIAENKISSDFSVSVELEHYTFGSFTNYKSALQELQSNRTLAKYFSKAKIYEVTQVDGEKLFLPHHLEASDEFMSPLVDGMSKVLFFDIYTLLFSDDTIYDEAGIPCVNSDGEIKTTSVPFIVIWLIIGSLYFTVRYKAINIRGFKHAIELVSGKHDKEATGGDVSHFQALATALSATVGLGNIGGVAVAIAMGGPGATLWMILGGFLGMSSKFIECTLGVKYRKKDSDGTVSGGPMYYLKYGLEKQGKSKLGKILALIFAVLCIGSSLGGGNMYQSNQAFVQLKGFFPSVADASIIFGIVMAVLVGIVIIGGIKSIAKITEKIVPIMAVLYVTAALVVLGNHFYDLDDAVMSIFNGAFSPEAMRGGIIGVLIIGFQRSAFSNEAGIGSASIAHASVKTSEPITEGIVALLEPFVDTIVICTMTALVIIVTGMHETVYGYEGAHLTSEAFGSVFPSFKVLLLVSVLLFAFSTMISWSFYGLKAWTYLFGDNKITANIYKSIFVIFIVVGASTSMDNVINFSDMMLLSMAFPNIIGLYFLSGEIKVDLFNYFKRIKDQM